MKAVRRLDLGIVIVMVTCLLAAYPFISRPGLPVDTDAELHVIRTAELGQLLRGGELYPRWAPDFYFGYGYPIFNYYAPLSYFVAVGLTLVPGIGLVTAVKSVFVIALLAAGLGMYLLVRSNWGTHSGIVAAAAYVYSPYVQYIDPYARGVLAESVALSLLPWVMWAFGALAHRRRERVWRLALASMILAALICSHNLIGAVACLILAGWIAWQWLESRTPRARDQARGQAPDRAPGSTAWLAGAVVLAIALSTFFWLPLIAERGAVQYQNLISEGGHYDYHTHFLSLTELLRPTVTLDLGATEPSYVFNVGVIQWMAALLGGLGLLIPGSRTRSAGLFWAVTALVLIVLMLPISSPVWETMPFMPFLQFPWRLLGPLAACLAVLAGAAVAAVEALHTPRTAQWATMGVVAAILITALPLSYPQEWPVTFGPTDPWGIMKHELAGRWLGTTSTGDYVPAGVVVVPRPNEQLLESYRTGGPPDRVNRVTLPPGTTVKLVPGDERMLVWTYHIEGSDPFIFRLFHFYFPGWTAFLDGQPVSIELAKPEGFMTIKVPAGPHELVVAFGDTPIRRLAWIVSALALLICLGLTMLARRLGSARKAAPSAVSPMLLIVPCAVWLFKLALADPLGWFRTQSSGLVVVGAEHQVYYELGHQIALIGYDWHEGEPGESSELILYWKALDVIDANYQVFVHLRDDAGAVVAQSDLLNPGDFPTERWPLDKYVRDRHTLKIPAEIPPGTYRLAVGLWSMADGERLEVGDETGQELGDSIILERLVVQ